MILTRPNSAIADMVEASYRKRRSFAAGFTITHAREVLLYDVDGNYYQWHGALPKIVPANSSPNSTGGMSTTAWQSVGTADDIAIINAKFNSVENEIQTLRDEIPESGKSAYDLYVETTTDNPPKTLEEWLASLKGETGSGLIIRGSFPDVSNLPMTGNKPGDAYIVQEQMWVWDSKQWAPVGQVGPEGKSAYDVWLAAGNTGTILDYLDSLRGPTGEQGPVGEKGDPGENATGFNYLGSLESTIELPPIESVEPSDAYTIGTYVYISNGESWINVGNIIGPEGKQGIQGEIGPEGKSAYEVWLEEGNQGTEQDFLNSLVGPTGPSGEQGVQGIQGVPGEGLNILDTLTDPSQLPETANPGEAYLVNDELYVWLANATEFTNVGVLSGISITAKGHVPSFSSLPNKDTYGSAYYTEDTGNLYIYTLNEDKTEGWIDMGVIRGKDGRQGVDGEPGAPGFLPGYTVTGDVTTITEQEFADTTIATISAPKPETATGSRYLVKRTGSADTSDYSGITVFPTPDGKYMWVFGRNAVGDGALAAYVMFVPDNQSISPSYLYYTRSGDMSQPPRSITPKGYLDSVDDLPTTGNEQADMYYIDKRSYIWDGDKWVDMGDNSGPQGPAGPQGPQGIQGIQGEPGPSLKIRGELTSTSQLPSTGVAGEGYIINGDFWVWVVDYQTQQGSYNNAGKIQGPQGPQGPQGIQGIQGSLWIALARQPGPADGRIGDYFVNTQTLEFFQKTSDQAWGSLGHMGGGNVYDAPSDGSMYARKNGVWTAFTIPVVPVTEAPTDGKTYGRKNSAWVAAVEEAPTTAGNYVRTSTGTWQRFNRYDLSLTTTTDTLDVSLNQTFKVDLTTAAKTLSITNLPSGRSMAIVIEFIGNAFGVSWSNVINWTDSTPPTYSANKTVITLWWDGSSLMGFKPGGY